MNETRTIPELIRDNLSIGGLDACWEWKGPTSTLGYGTQWDRSRRRNVYVHRFMYERARGPIPEGLTIDHLCRNRSCANQRHLEAVTVVENVMRGESLPAQNARKTHCIHGHEFTPENTYYERRGRQCRACRKASRQKRTERERRALAPPDAAPQEGL